MVYGDNVHPIYVVWSHKDGERSLGFGTLHQLLAQDPVLGLTVLRGLKEWEHGRMCCELWGSSRPYKPSQWAHFAAVGWLGCEGGRIWRQMKVGRQRKEKQESEGASTTTTPIPPPPSPSPPPKRGKGGKATIWATRTKRKRLN